MSEKKRAKVKAVILVGGYGTRLRPLTFSVPKPLVPFCNKPMVVHQLDALVRAGVEEIILAVNIQPETMEEFLQQYAKENNVKITSSKEEKPMGTAGPLSLLREQLGDADQFFMFNSDVICEYPLDTMLKFHRGHGGEGTIMVTPVEDPSRFGVVLSGKDDRVESFMEKPRGPPFPSHNINAGIYLFSKSVLDRIPDKPCSIEREIFPVMAGAKELYCMRLSGYWQDVGKPMDFLDGQRLHLSYLSKSQRSSELADSDEKNIIGNNLIAEGAKIDPSAVIGPNVSIGANCVIGPGTRIQDSCIMDGTVVGRCSYIKRSIVGWFSLVKDWVRIEGSVLGEDSRIHDEIVLNKTVVCPHKDVKESKTDTIVL